MNIPRWSPTKLRNKLEKYGNNLQIRIESSNGTILQGPINLWNIPDLTKRHIKIVCPYLCLCLVRFSAGPGRIERWVEWITDDYGFDFNYRTYCLQRKRSGIKGKEDRPQRIKFKTVDSEECWILQPGDPQCLVSVNERYYTQSMSPNRFVGMLTAA